MPTGTLPRIIQLPDGSYATPDGKGGWAAYTGQLPDGTSATAQKQPDFKVGDSDAINHAWDIVGSINEARDLAQKPLATGTAAAAITGIPVIGGVVGQNRANLQTKLGAIAGDLRQLGIRTLYQQTGQKGVGSVARNQAEQQALQNSLAPLGFIDTGGGHIAASGGPQPDAATLGQGLDTAYRIYQRHLARLYGFNPDDPSALKLIDNAVQDPSMRSALLQHAQNAATTVSGNKDAITESAPPPAITGNSSPAATSSDTQVEQDPNMARIKPQLEKMLAADPAHVSNDAIVQFMKQNGVNPANTTVGAALQYRMSRDGLIWRQHGGNYAVDPNVRVPLHGFRKFMAGVSNASPGGVPVGATAVGAADVGTFGAAPDIAGAVHDVTGVGPTRSDVITARDLSAQEHPVGTFAGNMAGALLSPIGRAGGIGRTLAQSGLYGFFGSEDPSLNSRLLNAGIDATVGAAAHGAGSVVLNGARPIYAAGRALAVPGEQGAVDAALARAAGQMPKQDLSAVAANMGSLRTNGAEPPAAAALSRSAQDWLARLASGSPAAHAVADTAAVDFRQKLPQALAGDFNQAIEDAAKASGSNASSFLNRPTREITNDIQNMAGREYETGIKDIANEPVEVNPALLETLQHEQTKPAIADALRKQDLSTETRALLRNLPQWLKDGSDYSKFPLTVDSARNIATALDRRASSLTPGSEGSMVLRDLSSNIRQSISDQYPEFAPVNDRYAARMGALRAMDDARTHFLNETPEGIDALAASSKNFTGFPGEAELRGIGDVSGPTMPSNREMAIAGAREAATTRAGAGTGAGGTGVAQQLAEGPNQQIRTGMVVNNPEAAQQIASRAGAKATVGDVLNRIASGPNADQTVKWFATAKRALMYKLTGGTAHYATAYAISGLPGMTSADAERVMRVYLNSQTADQAFNSLSKAYGAAKARAIISRMAGVASGAYTQHQAAVGSPTGGQ